MLRMDELRGAPDVEEMHEAWRHRLAALLRGGSALLVRAAQALERVRTKRRSVPELEFYAEAGAPEGAIYLDGQLAGRLPGVERL